MSHGHAISTRGSHVFCAYDGPGGQLVCVAATAKEARAKYYRARLEQDGVYGKAAPPYLNSHRDRPQQITAEDMKNMGIEGEGRVKS